MQKFAVAAIATLTLTACGTSPDEGRARSTTTTPDPPESSSSRFLIDPNAKCPTTFPGTPEVSALRSNDIITAWAGTDSVMTVRDNDVQLRDLTTGEPLTTWPRSERDTTPAELETTMTAGNGYTVSYTGETGSGVNSRETNVTMHIDGAGTVEWSEPDSRLEYRDSLVLQLDPTDPMKDPLDPKILGYLDASTGKEMPPAEGQKVLAAKLDRSDVANSPYDAGTMSEASVYIRNLVTGAETPVNILDADTATTCGDHAYVAKNGTIYVLDAATGEQISEKSIGVAVTDLRFFVRPGGVLYGAEGIYYVLRGSN